MSVKTGSRLTTCMSRLKHSGLIGPAEVSSLGLRVDWPFMERVERKFKDHLERK